MAPKKAAAPKEGSVEARLETIEHALSKFLGLDLATVHTDLHPPPVEGAAEDAPAAADAALA